MNEDLRNLMIQAGYAAPEIAERAKKLSNMIIFECIKIAVFAGDNEVARKIREKFQGEENG